MENMAQALQEQQQRIGQLTQQLQALQLQVQAQPGAALVRWNLKFDTFSFEGPNPAQDYDRFEQNCRMVSRVMGYQVPDVCFAILGQLRGKAADMGRSLIGTEGDYPNIDAFFTRLRSLFVSPAYQEKARSAFLSRIQQPSESVIAFHGILRSLWEKAYPVAERQETNLIRQFVAGLQDPRINERLHLAPQPNYNAALEEALRLEGTYEVINIEAQRRNQRGRTGSLPTHTYGLTGGSGPEPMDIGNVSFGNARGQGRGTYAYGRGMNRGQPYGRRNEFSRNQAPFAGPNRGGYQYNDSRKRNETNRNPSSSSGVANLAKDECRKCHQKGHWERDCRSKGQDDQKNDPKRDTKNWRQDNNFRRNVNAVETETDPEVNSDDTAEEDPKNELDWM